ncbi:hypothetical protein EV193_104265 [Herbihabitans rhizosphaerae]|uniref:Uncharacterized protein n=1 Tax=Herbihabitans rhizosphaerae TaxID=1872711 RepID=A0A4Q7KRD0_9PSEU|nr:hypothetical protein [Herbihabitans rhizosphaerae]RZS39054.1 hypothetical protein EV193_104265 [Herbihabitans rhizosphaerae]
MATVRAIGTRLATSWTEGRRVERIAYLVGAVLFVSGLFHVVVLYADGGSWEGPLSWRKAVTFGLSFGLTLATVAWVTSFVHMGRRTRAIGLGGFTAACVLEVGLVSMQTWRGVASHFNRETAFDSTISTVLAAGGAVIIITIGILTVAMFRSAEALPRMRLAIRVSMLAFVGALGIGAAMIAKGVIISRSGDPTAAYSAAGSLKPAHAVLMHAILVLPALDWLLSFTTWTRAARDRVLWLGIGSYGVLAAIITVESFTDTHPLDAPLLAEIATVAAVLALVVAGVAALRGVLTSRVEECEPSRSPSSAAPTS